MRDLEKVRNQLSGKTSFSTEQENDLFEKILEIEDMEKGGDGVPGLTKTDGIAAILLILILGIAPVIYYAVTLS